jgi:two-component system LytT family response regulator
LYKDHSNKTKIHLEEKLQQMEQLLYKTKKELDKKNEYTKELEAILDAEQKTKKSKIITIKSATKIEFINVDDIICCIADDVYTHIHLNDDKIITASKTLSAFEVILEGHAFTRISRSHLINTNHIITFFKDRNQILLKGDFLLDVARRRRVEFLKNI